MAQNAEKNPLLSGNGGKILFATAAGAVMITCRPGRPGIRIGSRCPMHSRTRARLAT